MKKSTQISIALTTMVLGLNSAFAVDLNTQTFNPGVKSIFPISSTLISGEKDAILVDAQFQKNDAQAVVKMIKDSGKNLKTIYISHSDPDFYFGLDTILASFPEAKVVSTAQTAYLINATKDEKLAIWGPQLKENKPTKIIVPEAAKQQFIELEGEKIAIKGADINPDNTYLWIDKSKTIVGGIQVVDNEHLWLADSQTVEARKQWVEQLQQMKNLAPKKVIPGHYEVKENQQPDYSIKTIEFSQKYLQDFETLYKEKATSAEIIDGMLKLYPDLAGADSFKFGVSVVKGESPWTKLKSYPLIGKKAVVRFGDMSFELDFKDNKTMTFVGLTPKAMKGETDTQEYTAIELSDNIFMVYWSEPNLKSNVVHIHDFNKNIVYTNIANPDGTFYNLKGTIERK